MQASNLGCFFYIDMIFGGSFGVTAELSSSAGWAPQGGGRRQWVSGARSLGQAWESALWL